MKLNTFLALIEINEVPPHLLAKWVEIHPDSQDPIKEARNRARERKNERVLVALFIILSVFLLRVLTGGVESEVARRAVILTTVGVLALAGYGAFAIQMSNKVPPFANDLEGLSQVLGLNYGQLAAMSFEESQGRVRKLLLEYAKIVVYWQKSAPTFHSPKQALESANNDRMQYGEINELFANFQFVTKEWDGTIWAEAQRQADAEKALEVSKVEPEPAKA